MYQILLQKTEVNTYPYPETAKSRQRKINLDYHPSLAGVHSGERSQEVFEWAKSKKNIKELGTGSNKKQIHQEQITSNQFNCLLHPSNSFCGSGESTNTF